MFFHDILDEEKEEAHEAGIAEGRAEGLAQGKTEGAHNKALESARNLLTMNLGTPEQIAQATGLSLDEVLSLQNETK